MNALALMFAMQGLAAAEPPTVEAIRASSPIIVDGALTETTWEEGEWQSGFTVLDNPEKPASPQTHFRVRFDEANLYVGVRLDEPDTGALRANAAERDGKVYSDDCMEVMIDPTGERIEYYHFVVNSLGTLYDAQLRQGGNVRSAEWNCNAESAAQVGEAAWTVELRVPIVELGLTAASTGEWAINVARERRGPGDELSSFVPLTGGFHQPSLYAALTLTGADFGKYLWEIKEPYEVRVLPGEDGKLTYAAKTHVANAGPKFRFIMLRGVLGESAGEWVKDGLDAGQGREYEFSVSVEQTGAQTLRLEIADRLNPEDLLAAKSRWVTVAYSPLTVTMLRPWYRDSIYATEELKQLVFTVDVSLPEADLQDATIVASLTTTRGGGSAAEPASARAAPRVELRVPIEDLAEGEYELRVALQPKGAPQPLAETSRTLRKLPEVEHEWRLDERNVLLHNGEPVLPFGWFSMDPEDMDDPGHAYTLMQDYNAQWRSVEENSAIFDRVVAAGTHVAVYPYPNAKMMEGPVWGQPLSDEEAQALRERVRAMKEHPGIFAWYMADEPELRPALPERCRRIYEVVAEEDPFHPCIMLNDTIAGIQKYVDGGDILMPDPYPCFIKGGLAAQPIEKVSSFVTAAVEAGQGRKAVWVTPQAFNYGDYGRQNQRGPNLTELRNELYQAVVCGAEGFLWYTYSQVRNYPDLDIGMRWLSFEVADLKDAVLADADPEARITVSAPRPEHIHTSARTVNGKLYLFAVNTATETQEVELRLEGQPMPQRLYVVSEGRRVQANEGVLEDRFGIYETHIYTTDEQVGQRESITVPRQRIAEADAARKKPGNLAFEDQGTAIEVSSRSTYGCTPDRVLDGILTGMRWQDGTPREFPDWLVVRWPQPVTVGRVVVYSPSIADLQVQVPEGDDWRTVGETLGNTEDRIEVTLNEPVATEAVRILVSGLRGDSVTSAVWEVEAYAE